jgi:hypothetical protein
MTQQFGFDDDVVDEKPDLNQKITGYFGSFKTTDSYQIDYLLSSLNLKDLKLLEIASEAFSFDQVDFEEMVQRDVDPVRVQEEIIELYLKEGKNKALFFPPLIVSVIAFDENDKPLHQFKDIDESIIGKSFIKRWDKHFAIEVRIADNSSSAVIYDKNNNPIPIHPYASKIHYDDKLVKLVVIDGQHRFYALKVLAVRQPDLIKDLNLPVCIVFSPDAIVNNGGQDVMMNLRNMFVTINNKAKDVSGNFLDLLNDHSLASLCVRELANLWKENDKDKSDSLRSSLQFMEWNQRNKSKSYQVNKQHAITTVSIIADVFRNNIFNSKKESKTYNLLKLESAKNELEKNADSTSIYDITENDFDVDQTTTLRKLAKINLVPCLDKLLLSPSVYKHIQDKYINALQKLEEKVDKGIDGWLTFKNLLKDFKEAHKLSPEAAMLAEREFYKDIVLEKGVENYKRNVFQQGYIRVWSQVADYLVAEFSIPAIITTYAIVESFEVIIFKIALNPFDKEQSYSSLLLYDKSGKPNVTVRGKQAWTEAIMCFFLENKTRSKFISVLQEKYDGDLTADQIKKIDEKLIQWANKALSSFSGELLERYEKDFANNWRTKEFPKAFKDTLESLLAKGDDESIQDYTNKIKEKSDYSFKQAIYPLYIYLGVEKSQSDSVTIFDSQEEDQI